MLFYGAISALNFSGLLYLESTGIPNILNDGNIASRPTNFDVRYSEQRTL